MSLYDPVTLAYIAGCLDSGATARRWFLVGGTSRDQRVCALV